MIANIQSHLTLKHAAEQFGVHAQTLRSWEKRGLIRMIRLPGSHYRRVPLSEVERLQESMRNADCAANVRFVPPQRDATVLMKAQTLAAMVEAELATLEIDTDLDQFMSERRGRIWSP